MSIVTCPHCGETAEILTEKRPDGNHICGVCGTTWPNVKPAPCPSCADLRDKLAAAEARADELGKTIP